MRSGDEKHDINFHWPKQQFSKRILLHPGRSQLLLSAVEFATQYSNR